MNEKNIIIIPVLEKKTDTKGKKYGMGFNQIVIMFIIHLITDWLQFNAIFSYLLYVSQYRIFLYKQTNGAYKENTLLKVLILDR